MINTYTDNDVTLKAEAGPNEDEGTPYYRPGEVVINTDYSKEFKSYLDGRYTLKQIRDHVARCICAFLNTGKKGMLLIGVDSRGRVVGIECNAQQEARYLQHFLDAVKDIYPPVFGEEYSFHFSPLLEDNGRQHPSLKVIEVRVFPPNSPDVLYECKEGVFVRRNGVLTGPIRPSHIQEWIKQKHFAELDDMRSAEDFLKDELNKKDETIRQQGDTIRSQRSEIERQRHVIESKGCNIL
ncbi:schlafen-like protein 1 [Ruditapes philippinarum]|uniref:schlafen-like protein 1 n=1 Tax=Ruditapes philippinarum TaxID=129788 RepID=UPI00295BA896|nr:schlafen-like protein 1 [Ruditapes philippinarum]